MCIFARHAADIVSSAAHCQRLSEGCGGVLQLVESITKLTAFRGFAGTSILILVGVATDTARRFRAEQAMSKYKDIDKLYDELKD